MKGHHYNLFIPDEQMERLRLVSEKTGLSVAEHFRRMIDCFKPLHDTVLSGSALKVVTAETTSGCITIVGRGY